MCTRIHTSIYIIIWAAAEWESRARKDMEAILAGYYLQMVEMASGRWGCISIKRYTVGCKKCKIIGTLRGERRWRRASTRRRRINDTGERIYSFVGTDCMAILWMNTAAAGEKKIYIYIGKRCWERWGSWLFGFLRNYRLFAAIDLTHTHTHEYNSRMNKNGGKSIMEIMIRSIKMGRVDSFTCWSWTV